LLLSRVQKLSGLTLEEIAPLIGVSRRTLQNWKAESNISARKEQRLRDLADCLDALPSADPEQTRQRLLERRPGMVRVYDLLAEGNFDSAYAAVTGLQPPAFLAARSRRPLLPPVPSVLARLSDNNDGRPLSGGRVDKRRSRRLKR
jgi:hypothetical protein